MPSTRGPAADSVTVIAPAHGLVVPTVGEVIAHRELYAFLVWRDVKVRYKQTALGILWAVLQPLVGTLLFLVVFGRLVGIPSDGSSYWAFALAAMVPWTFFARGLSSAATSLVSNVNLVTKVYFPRILMPASSVTAATFDLVVSASVLVAAVTLGGEGSGGRVFALPLVGLLAAMVAFGAGLGLAAINVRYRDVQHVLPFLTQLWFFATPVVYPLSLVPEKWQPIYALNPMVGVVEGFRWAVLGGRAAPVRELVLSAAVTGLVTVLGLLLFGRVERTFADVV